MSTVRLNEYSNSGYEPGAGKTARGLWYLVNALVFTTHLFPVYGAKVKLLRMFGAKVGEGVVIKPRVNIKYPWRLAVGDHSWIGEGVWIDNLEDVVIGSNVCVSQNATLLTGNHNFRSERFDLCSKPIVIQDGVWVGAFSVICPGVELASHAVVTVGSIMTGNAESYGVYQGNPAVLIKTRRIDNTEY